MNSEKKASYQKECEKIKQSLATISSSTQGINGSQKDALSVDSDRETRRIIELSSLINENGTEKQKAAVL